MNDYPLEPGQRMIIKPNAFGEYAELGFKVVLLHEVVSTEKGIIANCFYHQEQKELPISIPLFLLWRIADDEDLLEMHENYIHSKKLIQS